MIIDVSLFLDEEDFSSTIPFGKFVEECLPTLTKQQVKLTLIIVMYMVGIVSMHYL